MQEFAVASDPVIAGAARLREPGDAAGTERTALVGAAIGERVKFAADVEDADFASLRGHELARSRRYLGGATDDMTAHEDLIRKIK
jgi:hypothetical protein